MKVTKFWAKNFRSLRDVTVSPLGDFNVFYGENGAGKSNVLDALHALFSILPLAVDTAHGADHERLSFRDAGERAARWLRDDDFDARQPQAPIFLGAVIEQIYPTLGAADSGIAIARVVLEINFWRSVSGQPNLRFSRLLFNEDIRPGLPFSDTGLADVLRLIVAKNFTHLGVTRTLSTGADSGADPVLGIRPDGELVQSLFKAKNARDPWLRQRFDVVRMFLSSSLGRPAFDVFLDSDRGRIELREQLPEPNPQHADVSLDRAGHGVVQIYSIVATLLLAGGGLVAIEEPEAHLHAPTLGIRLRSLLVKLLQDGHIDQLFIATHSNLFDLDETGYFDVRLDPETRETKIDRKPLSEIDGHHLYEPGPAKRALAQYLRYAEPSERVYRRPDSTPVSAKELLRLLQEDDPLALDFLRSLHGAALRMVRLDLQKTGNKE